MRTAFKWAIGVLLLGMALTYDTIVLADRIYNPPLPTATPTQLPRSESSFDRSSLPTPISFVLTPTGELTFRLGEIDREGSGTITVESVNTLGKQSDLVPGAAPGNYLIAVVKLCDLAPGTYQGATFMLPDSSIIKPAAAQIPAKPATGNCTYDSHAVFNGFYTAGFVRIDTTAGHAYWTIK